MGGWNVITRDFTLPDLCRHAIETVFISMYVLNFGKETSRLTSLVVMLMEKVLWGTVF